MYSNTTGETEFQVFQNFLLRNRRSEHRFGPFNAETAPGTRVNEYGTVKFSLLTRIEKHINIYFYSSPLKIRMNAR